MNVFVFDIETIPDVAGGRRIYDLHDLSDADVAKAMMHIRQTQAGTDFLRHHLHQIVAISVVLRSGERFKVWTLGDEDSTEKEIICRFFDGLERFSPTLVSWNGSGFDLPVLHYRSLVHGVQAPRYWDTGRDDSSFRFNNYLNRFHDRHTDLMDVLAGYQPRASVGLDEMATLLGFPGKQGMRGDQVWDTYQAGGIKQIRDYCETDVLNTYLVYLRFLLIRGDLFEASYLAECERVREALVEEDAPHLRAFLDEWQAA
ncbi:MAG: 3'-5' exonuclease [Gammaproteobacteria bacterium]|nr:3'-5' exonuclease [Gammaproteobacteria bacterium]|tara:strand:+ start:2775 stop:3548 length:774 start_codon:yes stop_codon:yes gene_type:complete